MFYLIFEKSATLKNTHELVSFKLVLNKSKHRALAKRIHKHQTHTL